MQALRTVAMVIAVMLRLAGAAARADSLEDALFAACVASETYRDLPISESETCHCVAGIVPQHLTPKATKQITEAIGEGYVLDEASYIGGYGPVSTALHVQCPGVKAHWDRMNRPTDVPACKDAFKTHRDAVVIEWACKQDAEMGDAEAQFYMSWAFYMLDGYFGYDGIRPPGPRVDGMEWLSRSANQGYARAQVALGGRYAQGDGLTKDEAEAAKWYQLAADQGSATAQLNLGVLYEYGRGVPKDFVQAYKWYALAARTQVARNPTAQSMKNRDYIARKMTPAQLSAGQKLVDDWRPE